MGKRLRTGVGLTLALGLVAGTAQAAAPDVAATSGGPVKAIARGAMTTYFAIPYAAPPVGDLRWRAPQPPVKWTTPLARTKSGAACLQTGVESFRAGGDSEDCLYLDVHRPTGDGPFPVMVWIHGGAFTSGSSAFYADPSPLVSQGVIVVAMNYRLGALAFWPIRPYGTPTAVPVITASWISRPPCIGFKTTLPASAATPRM
ncbi:MAG: hypothetical protein CGW95_00125 [Phenylobacterium zucineum]|nr:MAG: hypothetical protein CGW95_00125 [Phenylobacterium zucineum]